MNVVPSCSVGCSADETGRDSRDIIAAFKACFPGDAGPPASGASSCERPPQDSD